MPPRYVDREKKQREIAMRALELFAEHGFETTSISKIAEASGIGKGTIYEYFSSKEELIIHALAMWGELMEREVEQLLGDIPDPLERLHTYVDTLLDRFLAEEKMIRLMFGLMPLLSNKEFQANQTIHEMFQGVHKFIIGILLDGISEGIFDPKIARDVEKIAINITAYLDGIAMHHFMGGGYFDLKEQCHFFLKHWLAGITLKS